MTRWLQSIITLCALAVTAAICLLCWQTARQAQAIGEAATALEKQLNAIPPLAPILDAISGPRGTLHEANKAIVKIGDAIVTTQLQERAIAPHTVAAVDSLKDASAKLGDAATSLSGTAQAATGTLNAATGTLTVIQTQAGPLMASYAQDGADLDALLKSHAVNDTLSNFDSMSTSGAGIMANGKTVSDKITYDFMHPVPAWKQPLKILQLGFDAALLAK